MSSIEDQFKALEPFRKAFGNPIKGALQTLVMYNTHDGWTCIVQYWLVARWNEASDPDPAICLSKALAMTPDHTPLSASVPAPLRSAIAERCGELVDEPNSTTTALEDLLV